MPAASKKHDVKVIDGGDKEFVDLYGGMWVAKCSCGEFEEARSTEERAERSKAAHLAEFSDDDE